MQLLLRLKIKDYRAVMAPLLFALALLTGAVHVANTELVLVLEDDFTDFNLSLWKHELNLGGGGNYEFQYYTNNRSNSYVEDGVLHIQPTLLADQIGEGAVRGEFAYTMNVWGAQPADLCTGNAFFGCQRDALGGGNFINPTTSARIRTAESFSFTYGRVEVRAKLPIGDWLWPAIWMLPTDNQYGNWPASGEVDIMESRGNPPSYEAGGYDSYGSTLHWGLDFSQNMFLLTHATKSGVNLAEDFHTYGLLWNETYIGTYLDEESNTVLSVQINESFWERGGWTSPPWNNPWRGRGRSAPFDRRFFLIINLAVGGVTEYFPDGVGGKPWSNSDPNSVNAFYNAQNSWYPTWNQTFQIDSVKVWSADMQAESVNRCPNNSVMPTSNAAMIAICSIILSISHLRML